MLHREVTSPRSIWPAIGLVVAACVLAAAYSAAFLGLVTSV